MKRGVTDVVIFDEGEGARVVTQTEAGDAWLRENTSAVNGGVGHTWLVRLIAVHLLVQAMIADGLSVRRVR